MFGRVGIKIAAMTCGTGGRRLACRPRLLHVTGFLRIYCDRPYGTGYHPIEHAWACSRSLMEFPGSPDYAGSFKAKDSQGVLLNCAYACSMAFFALTENGLQDAMGCSCVRKARKTGIAAELLTHARPLHACKTPARPLQDHACSST
eukprot:351159-Chlamydomonas_euryale.AAC.6